MRRLLRQRALQCPGRLQLSLGCQQHLHRMAAHLPCRLAYSAYNFIRVPVVLMCLQGDSLRLFAAHIRLPCVVKGQSCIVMSIIGNVALTCRHLLAAAVLGTQPHLLLAQFLL